MKLKKNMDTNKVNQIIKSEFSKKSKKEQKYILKALNRKLFEGLGTGLAIGGGLAAAGAMVGAENEKEHRHKVSLLENEIVYTKFTEQLDSVAISSLNDVYNKMTYQQERVKKILEEGIKNLSRLSRETYLESGLLD